MTPEVGQQLLHHLRRLIQRDHCVLSYDFDLIETLPDILREQYGIGSEADVERNADLAALYRLPLSARSGWWHSTRQEPGLARFHPWIDKQCEIETFRLESMSAIARKGKSLLVQWTNFVPEGNPELHYWHRFHATLINSGVGATLRDF